MARISMRNNDSKSIQEGINEFLANCRAMNYSPATITYYENTAHNFSLFCDLERDIGVLNKELIQQYQVYLADKKLADKTIKTYITGLRTILYYFMDEGYIGEFHIVAPKVDEQIKEVYTDEEMEKLLKKPNMKKCTFTQYRNWVLAVYFIGTGQRLNSGVNIKIASRLNDFIYLLRRGFLP